MFKLLLVSRKHKESPLYRGTGINSTQAFTQIIDTLLSICRQLSDWEYLDFGGGFGYAYQKNGLTFDWV